MTHVHTSKFKAPGSVFNHIFFLSALFSLSLSLFQNIRDILLVGHRQAVAWIDEWHGGSLYSIATFIFSFYALKRKEGWREIVL